MKAGYPQSSSFLKHVYNLNPLRGLRLKTYDAEVRSEANKLRHRLRRR
jgi:hypothetical protein